MSAVRNLRLQVVLAAIDKITAPIKAATAGSVGLARTLKETRDQLKALRATQGQIDTFRNLSRDAAITGNQLKAARDKVRLLSQQMAATDTPSKAMTRQFQEATRAASALKQRQQELAHKLQTARIKLDQAGISTRELASHQRTLKQQIASTTASLAQQEQRLARVNAQQKRLAATKASYGKTTELRDQLAGNGAGALAAGTATGAALMVPVGEYAKAENSATQLKVAMMNAGGQVQKEFGAINQLATQLGNQLPGTTSDFQDMMRVLIQKGMSAKVVLGGAGEATAKLAVLTNVGMTESANAISVLQDSMGVLDKDMVSAADQMQRLYNVGMDIGQIQEGFKAMGPALSYVRKGGIDAVKALAPLLAITDAAGMDASSAGNAYNKIIRGSVDAKKVDKSNALLKGTGVKLDFVDARGNFAGIDNMFNQIMKLNSLSDQKRKTVIETIFGSDKEVAEVLNALGKAGNSGIAAMRQKLESQASLQERVKAQLGTLKNLWDSASGTFTNAMVNFGEAIAPELKAVTEWIGNLSERLGTWAKENPALAGTLMKIAAVTAVVLVGVGALGLVVASVLGPLALARLSLSVLGIRMGALLPNMESVRTAAAGLGPTLGRVATGARGTAAALGGTLARAWAEADPKLASKSVADYARNLKTAIPEAAKTARLETLFLWDSTKKWAGDLKGSFKERLLSAGVAIKGYTANVWKAVLAQRAAMASKWTGFKQYAGTAGAKGMAVDGMTAMRTAFKGGVNGAISGVTSGIMGIGRALLFVGRLAMLNPIGLTLAAAALLVIKYWEPIKAFFSGFWQGLVQGLAPLAGIFGQVFAPLATALAPMRPVWDWLVGALQSAWNWVTQLFTPINATRQSLDAATQSGRGFGSWLASIVVIAGQVLAGFAALPVKFVTLGVQIMQGLVTGIGNGLSDVKGAITNAGSSVITWFKEKLGIHSPSRVFAQLGGFTMAGLEQGLNDTQGGPLSTVTELAKKLTAAGAGITLPVGAGNALPVGTSARKAAPDTQGGPLSAVVELAKKLTAAGAGIALTTGAAVAGVDTRPPMAAPAASFTSAPAAAQPIQIIINAAPGMSEERIAKLVAAEVEKLQRRQQARGRSSLRDND